MANQLVTFSEVMESVRECMRKAAIDLNMTEDEFGKALAKEWNDFIASEAQK